jgi:hypothetical protein
MNVGLGDVTGLREGEERQRDDDVAPQRVALANHAQSGRYAAHGLVSSRMTAILAAAIRAVTRETLAAT